MSTVEIENIESSVIKELSAAAWLISFGIAVPGLFMFFSLSLVIISRELPLALLAMMAIIIFGGAVGVGAGLYGLAKTIMRHRCAQ